MVQEPSSANLPLKLSFDDVLIEPGYSALLPSDVSLKSQLGKLKLEVPILSAAMDTVTESQTAIAMAQLGGAGVIHKNLSIESQAKEIRRVKKFQNAVIEEPLTVRETDTLQEVHRLIEKTGVTGFPVVDSERRVVGMCTGRDIRYAKNDSLKVHEVMTTPVHTLSTGVGEKEAVSFFREHKVEKLPLVDERGMLCGLITSRDWRQTREYPNSNRDSKGNLIVGAAVGVGVQEGLERSQALVEEGVDCLVVDSAHGHSLKIIETIKELRAAFPDLSIVGGNVGTVAGAKALVEAGADIVKIGIGPGSICTTRIVSGAGLPQFSAIYGICQELRKSYPEVGFIGDGGIRFSGDMTKALAGGAHAVMLGSLLAGTQESPGEEILYQGRRYKSYRGMGSIAAMKKGSKERYRQSNVNDSSKLVPEGVEARVPYRGPLRDTIYQLLGGVRSGMGYVGAATLVELFNKVQFNRISPGALRESHVHDVAITAEAPNYSGTGAHS